MSCQSIDVDVDPSKLKNSVHRAKITIESIIVEVLDLLIVILGKCPRATSHTTDVKDAVSFSEMFQCALLVQSDRT